MAKEGKVATARAVALAGSSGVGKTSLMEALLFVAGARTKQGRVDAGDTHGDASPEARERCFTTELNIARFDYLGDRFTLFDLPGSIEFVGESLHVLPAVDVVIAVVEPDPARIANVQPTLKRLDELGVPHMIFVNKIDQASVRARDLLAELANVSPRPLVMRQIPIWDGERPKGFIDLALERAYVYRDGQPSQHVDIPSELADREADARFQMLEKLADYDDTLMEALLEESQPERERVFADLARELAEGHITPVFLGSALHDGGVRRLLKALRHETPDVSAAAARLTGSAKPDATSAYVMKTIHADQAGKISIARVLSGALGDGETLTRADDTQSRAGGLYLYDGGTPQKTQGAKAGDVIAIGRADELHTGDLVVAGGAPLRAALAVERPAPVYARAVTAAARADEVKLATAMSKIVDEDTSLVFGPDPDTGELMLGGQGDLHLRTALARLNRRFNVSVASHAPATPYRETIRKGATMRGRHKKQTGGHGQFGDVVIEVAPLARGEGFLFESKITGGVVPRQYIPAVEAGVRDACEKGPLGFPVVDVAVKLTDGSYHTVDSSELAFRTAGRIGMNLALPECAPVLLEPIWKVEIFTPADTVSRVTQIITARRGQILGFDARQGWAGWDRIEAFLPKADLADLILELRSATSGVGTYLAHFDHYAELTGRLADKVTGASTGVEAK
jgi:elongation factor G